MNAILARLEGWPTPEGRAWPTAWARHTSIAAFFAAAFTLALSLPCQANEAQANESEAANTDDSSTFAGWTSVENETLAENRGGTAINLGDLGLNIASNNSTLTGNMVSGDVDTGQITANSLNDVSGINSLMFNSGNNVSFQNSMQINIFLK